MDNVKYENDTPVQGEYRNVTLNLLKKFENVHEEQRKIMSKEEKLIDERMFNYFFEIDEMVILDSKNITIIDNESRSLTNYLNKIGTVKRSYADVHAFGRGYSYDIDVEFENVLIKAIPAYYLIKAENNEKL